MAHPKIEPQPGENFGTQQGVGQGTVGKRRRSPRKEVDDVSISQADGLTLGSDGNYHPLETDRGGNLKATVVELPSLMQEMVALQKASLFVLAELAKLEYDEVLEEFLYR